MMCFFLWWNAPLPTNHLLYDFIYSFWYYRVYHLINNPTEITYYGTKMKSEAGPPRVIDSARLSRDTRIKVTLVARPLLLPFAQKLCRCEHDAFSSRTCVHSWTLLRIEIASVRKAFSNAYPDREVQNKTTIHRLVSKFGTQEVFARDRCSSSDRTAEITAVQLQTTGYGFKNSVLPVVSSFFCVKVFMCSS
jgi:hypothetical protein